MDLSAKLRQTISTNNENGADCIITASETSIWYQILRTNFDLAKHCYVHLKVFESALWIAALLMN